MAELWTEIINPDTGKSSLETHTLRVVKTWCKPTEHYFESSDDVRLVTCKNCDYSTPFVIGYHQLNSGKLSKK